MAEAEDPARLNPGHEVTLDDVRALMGASTPHFALQLRNRLRKLVGPLDRDHPARLAGEQEIARLERIAFAGETRGIDPHDGMPTLPSVGREPPHAA